MNLTGKFAFWTATSIRKVIFIAGLKINVTVPFLFTIELSLRTLASFTKGVLNVVSGLVPIYLFSF